MGKVPRLTLALLFAAGAMGWASGAAHAEIIYDTGGNGRSAVFAYDSPWISAKVSLAQPFVTPSTGPYTLTSISVQLLSQTGFPPDHTPAGTFFLCSATPEGEPSAVLAPLGAVSDIAGSATWYTLTPADGLVLQPGTEYLVVADQPFMNAMAWVGGATGPLSLRHAQAYGDPTASWDTWNTPLSLVVDANPVPEPALAPILACTLIAALQRRSRYGRSVLPQRAA